MFVVRRGCGDKEDSLISQRHRLPPAACFHRCVPCAPLPPGATPAFQLLSSLPLSILRAAAEHRGPSDEA